MSIAVSSSGYWREGHHYIAIVARWTRGIVVSPASWRPGPDPIDAHFKILNHPLNSCGAVASEMQVLEL